MASRTGKMQQWLNYKIKVTIQDKRDIVGQFLAFDRYMNLIIADAEEFRRIGGKSTGGPGMKRKGVKILKRTLGLVLLRGENIVSMSIEASPPPEEIRNRQAPVLSTTGAGVAKAAGRGLPLGPGLGPGVLPPGLAGPVKGLGGPAPSAMMPGQPKFGPGSMPPGMPKYPPNFPPYGAPPAGMFPPGMPPKFPAGMPPMYGAPGGGFPPGMPKYPGSHPQ